MQSTSALVGLVKISHYPSYKAALYAMDLNIVTGLTCNTEGGEIDLEPLSIDNHRLRKKKKKKGEKTKDKKLGIEVLST